jgi:predicted O-linked N-acetylglucosamine transferase (SPINDLY family)
MMGNRLQATLEHPEPGAAVQTGSAPVLTNDPSALIRGIELQNKGQIAEAEALFRFYLTTHPADGAALYSLAVILIQRGDQPQALDLLSNGVALCPNFAPLWMAHANALQSAGRYAEALSSYDKALVINPEYVEVLLNSGVLLREQQRHLEALERFKRVLAIKPDHEAAMGNSGIILTEFKRSDEAIAMFERLLAVNPNYDYGQGLVAYERLHACDWTGFTESRDKIITGIKARQRTCKSLPLMAFSDDCADHQISAQIFAARFPASKKPLWNGERYRHKKIRLAYVSPDLREHPVGHLMCGIFEHHDKSRFETVAISLGIDDKSRLRSRMLASFDKFVDARAMTSRQIAELMRGMEIDVAVDLAGYTADSRTDVFANRPVPAQANFLGYPGTMGTGYMDYIIADQYVIPPEHQRFYNEKVVYLPDAYLPTDASVKIADRTPTRQECGLPETGIVFCSFSHDYKINPPLFDSWMRLLAQVPGSVLWLMSRNQVSQANLRKEAQARGIDPARLVFAGRVPLVEDHMARYRQADIFLDTHPYNAHTTAADALMAGLPVVTFMGGAFPARVAASLLNAIGLPELVADSAAGYEALALALARDPVRLQAIKAKLAVNRMTHALFDTERFCRNLEAIYIAMWRQTELEGAVDALSAPTPV